jgi:hypothetical protein
MSKSSEAVKRWRANTKQRMVDSMGGCCVICGYNRCLRALDFHHLDPSEKDFGFGSARGNPASWSKLVNELRKCVCVCRNCHAELHDGMIKIPKGVTRFNEEYVDYKKVQEGYDTFCPICNEPKPPNQKFCSRKCSGTS